MARVKGQGVGGRYRHQGVDPITGRRLNIRAETLSELEARMRRVQEVRDDLKFGAITPRQAQGKLRPAQGLQLSVRELCERYIRGTPPASERIYRSTWRTHFEAAFGDAVIWDLTETRMREWLTDERRARRRFGKRGFAPKTIRAAWDFLRGALRLAVRDNMLSEFPWGAFTVPNPKHPEKEREVLRDPAEFFALLAAAKAYDEARERTSDGRYVAIVFLTLTGLRQAEAAGLAWSDVALDRDPPEMHVRRQATRGWPRLEGGERPQSKPKGGVARSQSLHPGAAAALRFQRSELAKFGAYSPDGPVFPRPGTGAFRTSGRVLSPLALRDTVRRAGLPDPAAWVVHSLRHSFARLELLGHGGDLRTVAARTGHQDMTVLQGYLQKPARGISGSGIPELPHALGVPAIAVKMIELPRGFTEAEADGAQLAALPEYVPENHDESFPALARVWIENGRRPRPRPFEVTTKVKAAYSRGYQSARGRGETAENCRAAGKRARRGALGAWAQALAVAERSFSS